MFFEIKLFELKIFSNDLNIFFLHVILGRIFPMLDKDRIGHRSKRELEFLVCNGPNTMEPGFDTITALTTSTLFVLKMHTLYLHLYTTKTQKYIMVL